MQTMYEEEKSPLQKLQSLDEPTKRKVVVGASAVAMVIVVYFWVAYFNGLVAGFTQSPVVAETAPADATAPVDVTAQTTPTMQPTAQPSDVQGPTGVAWIFGQFMNMLHGLGNILQAPRQYIVRPPQ